MPILALQHKQWRLQLKWLLLSFLHEEINPEMDQRARDQAKTSGRWCGQRPIKCYCLQTFLSKQVSMILEEGGWYSFIVCVAERSIVNGHLHILFAIVWNFQVRWYFHFFSL
jgi:hypothetical protein